jgi:hypothetical protein
MRGKRIKWIRKVVVSRHPKIMEMLKERFGEEKTNKMTYSKVIKECKKLWKEKAPGVEKWEIYKLVKES